MYYEAGTATSTSKSESFYSKGIQSQSERKERCNLIHDESSSTDDLIHQVQPKMNDFQVFVAICKAYCAVNIMVLPKNFENGGWLVGVLSLNLGCILVGYHALKLVKCAIKLEIYDFREVALRALGPRISDVISIIIAVVHFSFTIAQISFTLRAVQTVVHSFTGFHLDQLWISTAIILLYSPIAWIRQIAVFSKGFPLAIMMILLTTITIMIYAIWFLVTDGPANDGFQMINSEKYWGMIGFSFYTFEGIGALLPIMKEAENPHRFPVIFKKSFTCLASYFTLFGTVCYVYFGNQKEPIVINNISEDNPFMRVIKLLFCVNLVCSYPLAIFPTNKTIEYFLFSSMKEGLFKYWVSNFSRMIVCFLGCLFSIQFQAKLDKFLGLSGALLGIPLILIVPNLCHLKICAESKRERFVDLAMFVFSVAVMMLCSYNVSKAFFAEMRT